jgi:hypothetical protein
MVPVAAMLEPLVLTVVPTKTTDEMVAVVANKLVTVPLDEVSVVMFAEVLVSVVI